MRSYLFTTLERKIIEGFLNGEVKASDDIMRQIAVRMRTYKDLPSDILLYNDLRMRLTKP
jgi:hypothetical protein